MKESELIGYMKKQIKYTILSTENLDILGDSMTMEELIEYLKILDEKKKWEVSVKIDFQNRKEENDEEFEKRKQELLKVEQEKKERNEKIKKETERKERKLLAKLKKKYEKN